MTHTPDTTRDALERAARNIQQFCDDPNGSESPVSLALGMAGLLPALRAALRAIDGEGEDKWTAAGSDVRTQPSGQCVARCFNAVDARRIASDHNRLPALERAARAVVAWRPQGSAILTSAINTLAAALDEKD